MGISLKTIDTRVTTLENKGGSGIGFGQKWYDVTNKRTQGTTYTNTTGIPIMINVYDFGNGGTQAIYVDDLKVAQNAGSNSQDITISAIIPPNSTYKLTGLNGQCYVLELRSNNL